MQILHELGHIVAALATGGKVVAVVLDLASFSRTDVSPNPHPLVVVWSGPLVGAATPVIVWLILHQVRSRLAGMVGFLAGFCLLANGAYICVGSFDRIGDAGEMVSLGTPVWLLWIFGTACAVAGLLLWHRLLAVVRAHSVSKTDLMPAIALFVSSCLVFTVV